MQELTLKWDTISDVASSRILGLSTVETQYHGDRKNHTRLVKFILLERRSWDDHDKSHRLRIGEQSVLGTYAP